MTSIDLKPYLDTATRTALKAGELLTNYFGKIAEADIESKTAPCDLVSIADKTAEDLIKDELLTAFPDTGFIGEESTDNVIERELNWVVDPLDGTSNYLSHVPIWSVSIALCDARLNPLAGVVFAPMFNKLWTAHKGGGTNMNGKPVRVRPEPPGGNLMGAMLATGFPYDMRSPQGKRNMRYFNCMQVRFHKIRRMGSAAIDLAFIAEGTFDGLWELGLKAWDTAAGVLLVSEAGGNYCQINGSEYTPGDSDLLVCATPELRDIIIEKLSAVDTSGCD